jgi:hypothetical protein
LKRQAARFRVYGLNGEGRILEELTADNAEIVWSVHLANKKATWFQFQLAQDIPEATSAPPQSLRNPAVGDRSKLIIDPGPREVAGRDRSGDPELKFDTGRFMDAPVYPASGPTSFGPTSAAARNSAAPRRPTPGRPRATCRRGAPSRVRVRPPSRRASRRYWRKSRRGPVEGGRPSVSAEHDQPPPGVGPQFSGMSRSRRER